jgi:hypothetical protein
MTTTTVPPARRRWASAAERALRVFALAFCGQLVASGLGDGLTDTAVWQKAAAAGVLALADLVLSTLGTGIGNTATPSLLPARLDPTTPPIEGATP